MDDVHANIPLDEIQHGQWCVAYGVVHVGSPPYYFEWSGQFDETDVYDGPLGRNQFAADYMEEDADQWARVDVWTDSTKSTPVGFAQVNLNIDDQHAYNSSCEG